MQDSCSFWTFKFHDFPRMKYGNDLLVHTEPCPFKEPITCVSEYYQEFHILCWARMSFLLWYTIFHDFWHF